ncbi:MAG TPA: glycosyltransferase family 1 protein [Microbacteriaceae bacterium]|jgi:glycosyltransferase involved in cell wall biosynthesis|nr:glycosyltransferase family 1 protein [Microbacteriaceae bacterium]
MTSQPAAVRELIVDDRWSGEHGIGRFATEVIARLAVPWRSLGGGESPTSPLDMLNRRRLGLGANEVVYSPGFNAGLTRARQLLNIHDLIHLEIESERSVAKTVYYNTVVRAAVRRAGVVMTDSGASARAISAWVRDDAVEIVVVGCGRSAAFTPDGPRAAFDRATFVYVGNISKPHKNFDVLLDAIALRPGYALLVVTGDAALAEEKVASRGLAASVTVRTGVPDSELATIYRAAAGSLQPSLLEGFGLPPLEATSCATRVAYVASCESVSEIVAGTGVAVSSATDAAGWASAMDELVTLSGTGPLQMPAEWHARYEWDTVAAKVQAVLDDFNLSRSSWA